MLSKYLNANQTLIHIQSYILNVYFAGQGRIQETDTIEKGTCPPRPLLSKNKLKITLLFKKNILFKREKYFLVTILKNIFVGTHIFSTRFRAIFKNKSL